MKTGRKIEDFKTYEDIRLLWHPRREREDLKLKRLVNSRCSKSRLFYGHEDKNRCKGNKKYD